MRPDYKIKSVTIREGNGYKVTYLIAVPYSNADKSGFRIYQTHEPEKFDVRDHQPLIGAMLYETSEKAIHAGELVLRLRSRRSGYNAKQ